MKKNIPELLAPAGSFDCYIAALSAGADAVYFGAGAFNARAFASGFTEEELVNAFELSRLYDKKINITLNTLVFDREVKRALECAEKLINMGADTFIIQDLGLARELKRMYPEVILHASTQMTCGNISAFNILKDLGFSRVVIPREAAFEEISYLCANAPIETEVFLHGALCVSYSGQCLFSSVVGNRSGNRGECAQPCRMMYRDVNSKNKKPSYPLSLKDNCLGKSLRKLIVSGVTSLKIEGRMKSPEYVYGVVSTYRKALDEERDLTAEEYDGLRKLFSRNGFTSSYFDNDYQKSAINILGTRTDEDKTLTREAEESIKKLQYKLPKLPVKCEAEISEAGTKFTLSHKTASVTVSGERPQALSGSRMDEKMVSEQLTRLGGTPFFSEETKIELSQDLFLSKASLNALRREASSLLEKELRENKIKLEKSAVYSFPEINSDMLPARKTSLRIVFTDGSRFDKGLLSQICKIAPQDSEIFIPFYSDNDYYLFLREKNVFSIIGISGLPFYSETEREFVLKRVSELNNLGFCDIICENLAQVFDYKYKALGLKLHGGMRLNATNRFTCEVLTSLGIDGITISRELSGSVSDYTKSALRKLKTPVITCEQAYGYAELMLLKMCLYANENGCVKSGSSPRSACDCKSRITLRDRTGAEFTSLGVFGHRNTLLNSVPTFREDIFINHGRTPSFADKAVFSVTKEAPEETLKALKKFLNGEPPKSFTRR